MQSTARLIAIVSSILTVGCGEKPSASADAGRGDSGTRTDGGYVSETPDAGPGCVSGLFFPDGGCAPGCLDDRACQSGICDLSSHDCRSCRRDDQCADGRVCGTGTCDAVCTSNATCPNGWNCCGGRCVDPSRDSLHCGGCQACTGGMFCGQAACHATVFNNVCKQPVLRVILDAEDTDNDAGTSMAAALARACGSGVTLVVGAPADAGVLDVITGEPLRVGELLVIGGGSFAQKPVAWLEEHSLVPVVVTSTSDDLLQYSKRTGGTICTRPFVNITDTHDVFVVELATAPSGAVVLIAAGYYGPGTAAAAWYVVNRMVPNLTSLAHGWYVVEWTDHPTSGSIGAPDGLDTWTPIASDL